MYGGEYRNRTDLHGFAIRCVTSPPTRRSDVRSKDGDWERQEGISLAGGFCKDFGWTFRRDGGLPICPEAQKGGGCTTFDFYALSYCLSVGIVRSFLLLHNSWVSFQ
jgi:hypothetical protein